MDNLGIKKATMINFLGKYSNVLVQIILNSILARLLTPNEYGIVAIITIFINFFNILADLGIGPAIIQDKSLNKKEISDIFLFTVFISVILAFLFILFSYPLSYLYEDKVYIGLGKILSLSIFFNVLNIVPNSLLLKDKKFKTLGIRTVVITFFVGIITIMLAVSGFTYYSLVINSVLFSFFTFIFNFYFSGIKIFFKFDIKSIKKIKEYSSYQLGFNCINYFSRNLDNIFIGKFLGASPLGFYDKAYRLMLYPIQNLTHVITPVLHPILSEYQQSREIIYDYYIKLVKILSLIGVFISVYCFFSAREIVIVMFGEQWIQSINSFKILSISIWPQMISGIIGSIFQATGETKKLFNTGIINTSITIFCIIIGLVFGKIEYVSIGVVISFLINLVYVFNVIMKYIFYKKLNEFYKHLISSVVILGILILTYYLIPIKHNNVIMLLFINFIKLSIGYIIGLWITKEFNLVRKILIK